MDDEIKIAQWVDRVLAQRKTGSPADFLTEVLEFISESEADPWPEIIDIIAPAAEPADDPDTIIRILEQIENEGEIL